MRQNNAFDVLADNEENDFSDFGLLPSRLPAFDENFVYPGEKVPPGVFESKPRKKPKKKKGEASRSLKPVIPITDWYRSGSKVSSQKIMQLEKALREKIRAKRDKPNPPPLHPLFLIDSGANVCNWTWPQAEFKFDPPRQISTMNGTINLIKVCY